MYLFFFHFVYNFNCFHKCNDNHNEKNDDNNHLSVSNNNNNDNNNNFRNIRHEEKVCGFFSRQFSIIKMKMKKKNFFFVIEKSNVSSSCKSIDIAIVTGICLNQFITLLLLVLFAFGTHEFMYIFELNHTHTHNVKEKKIVKYKIEFFFLISRV